MGFSYGALGSPARLGACPVRSPPFPVMRQERLPVLRATLGWGGAGQDKGRVLFLGLPGSVGIPPTRRSGGARCSGAAPGQVTLEQGPK